MAAETQAVRLKVRHMGFYLTGKFLQRRKEIMRTQTKEWDKIPAIHASSKRLLPKIYKKNQLTSKMTANIFRKYILEEDRS